MGNVILDQAIPTDSIAQQDPFLLIHHWHQDFPGDQDPRNLGVGPHPHRGFSPITVVFKGSLHHRDSLGNSSIVEAGGVQWMNAGKGITHSERPSKTMAVSGGEFEIIQFWLNTPAIHKMDPARYEALNKEDIPVIELDELGSHMNLIAGSYDDVEGPAPNQIDMMIATLEIKEGAKVVLKDNPGFSTLIYQLDGRSEINEKKMAAKMTVVFDEGEGSIEIEGLDDSRFLLLSAEPINEKVSSYGPFVMNNTTEIMEAIRDAQMGKMGVLIEEFE